MPLAFFQRALEMILTTTLLIVTVLLLLLLVDKCTEGVAVDVTLKKYHNASTGCSAGTSLGCDYMFTMNFDGASSNVKYKTLTTDPFTTDADNNINFKTGNDALKSGEHNPITINLNSVEDITLKVEIVDDDLLWDDYITDFTMNLDVKNKTSHVHHTLNYTTLEGSGLYRISYKVYCDGNEGGIGCTGCKQNYYSANCSKFCQPYNNFTCDINGDHICKPNYYNTSCNVHCVPTSRYTCSNNGSRECLGRWTGDQCDTQIPCPSGQYGVNCSVNCTEVPGRYTCNSTTGEKVCEGHWAAPECDSCETHYYGSDCNTFCQASPTWNCSDTGEKQCLGHFTGKNCSLCKSGWFGSGCDLYCDLNSTLWTCDDKGDKTCAGKRKGANCTDCIEGWYGANCSVNCDPNSSLWTCDDNGNKICTGKRKGRECTDCEEGWYGADCSVECTSTQQYTCTDQGNKTCAPNWAGSSCDRCKEGYFGPNCTCQNIPGRGDCDSEGVLHCLPDYYGPQCSLHSQRNADLKYLPKLSRSLLVFCVITGVVFSLAVAIALFGVLNKKKIIRRRLSSLKIKPELMMEPVAFKNHYFVEPPSPVQNNISIEIIEDM